MKFHYKASAVEALQWTGENIDELRAWTEASTEIIVWSGGSGEMTKLWIEATENRHDVHIAHLGDWVIRSAWGVHTCKPDVFEQMFEIAEARDSRPAIEYARRVVAALAVKLPKGIHADVKRAVDAVIDLAGATR